MSIITSTEQDNVQIIQWDDGKANAVSAPLLQELNQALDQAERDKRVVLLVGRPGRFSAGFDLQVMGQGGTAMAELVVGGARLALRLMQFPTPVVMVCSGHSLAMGGLLLQVGDYRLGVSGDFKIGLNEVAIGMTMPWFGVEISRGRLQPSHFQRAVVNSEIYTPETALAAGFLDQVCAPEAIMEAAMRVSASLSQLNMAAHHATKLRVREQWAAAVRGGVRKDFGENALPL